MIGQRWTGTARSRWISAAVRAVVPLAGLLPAGVDAGPLPAGAASCLACHGSGPAPAVDGAPPDLRTLSAQDIEAALAAFRAGTRGGSVMPRIARGFTAHEIHRIAQALARRVEPAP